MLQSVRLSYFQNPGAGMPTDIVAVIGTSDRERKVRKSNDFRATSVPCQVRKRHGHIVKGVRAEGNRDICYNLFVFTFTALDTGMAAGADAHVCRTALPGCRICHARGGCEVPRVLSGPCKAIPNIRRAVSSNAGLPDPGIGREYVRSYGRGN